MTLQPDRNSPVMKHMKICLLFKIEISKMTSVKDIRRGASWAKEASLAAMSSLIKKVKKSRQLK